MAMRHASVVARRHETLPSDAKTSALALLRHRDFRLLWAGQSISRLGDQFYLIALPWLVLQVTGSAVEMGTVLALGGVPRALFMLIGGAITDRFSPRAVIVASYLARLVVVSVLATLIAFSAVALWMIYLAAFLFGLADAFHFPAQNTIVPRGMTKDHLDIANMLNQSASQLSMSVGPVVAGATIALVGGRGAASAMIVDAVSFAVGAWLIALIRISPPILDPVSEKPDGVLTSIGKGLSYVWHDTSLRRCVPLFAAIGLLVDGPFTVGAPLLAHNRFPEGAAAFGIVASAFGVGLLVGTIVGGVLPRPRISSLHTRLLTMAGVLGVCTAVFGLAPVTWLAAATALVMGAANGYVVIVFVTWIQRRTPDALMGRMMSILMMSSVGLNPLSTAMAGAVAGVNVTAMLVGSGVVLIGVVVLSAVSPGGRHLERNANEEPEKLSA